MNILSPRNNLIKPRGVVKPAKFFFDQSHPLSRGLVGYWPLGDSARGITQDISSYGKHATINVTSGAPILGYSHHGGQSLNTNAGTNFCTAKPVVTVVPLSFSIWAKLTALPSSGVEDVMMALNAVGSLNEFWMGIINSSGTQSFRVTAQQSGVARWYIVSFGDTNWHHYVGVYNDINTFTLYIDGVVQAASQAGSAISAPTGIDTASIAGFNYNTSSYYGQWNGLLEGARIYNRALSAVEVKQLYIEPYAGVYGLLENLTGSVVTALALLAKGSGKSFGKAALAGAMALKVKGFSRAFGKSALRLVLGLKARGRAGARGKLGPSLVIVLLARGIAEGCGRAGARLTTLLVGRGTARATGKTFFSNTVITLKAKGRATAKGAAKISSLLLLRARSLAGGRGRGRVSSVLKLRAVGKAVSSGRLRAKAFGSAVYTFTAYFWRRPKL